MTDEQRKQVDQWIENADACMVSPTLMPEASASSLLAIAIMLRDMLDKPQEPKKRVSYGWRCKGCNKLTPNSVPACWHCCPREWQTPVWREEFGEVVE